MITQRRPTVTLHFAQSLDGKIASPGRRTKLSTHDGLLHAHLARATHDAVLVGIKTVLIDNPILSVRLCPGPQPIRIVLSSTLFIPNTSQLTSSAGGPVLVIGARGSAKESEAQKLREWGAEAIIAEAAEDGRVSLPHALSMLFSRGIRRLLVEGGSQVLTSFLREKLADRAEIEIAPLFLGSGAVAAFEAFAGAPAPLALQSPAIERLGENFIVHGQIEYA